MDFKNPEPKVIGISGKTGAGKTTLTKALAQALQATTVHWDDFDEISEGPEDYVDWYKRGQDYKEWNYKALADVLQSLKSNKSITHPVLGELLAPTQYIVFDAPLGRLHEQTGQYIDRCIHLEVPLDVSLSRWLIRDFKSTDKTKDELLEELEFYLSHSRPLFFDDELKESADLCIDGMLRIDQQVEVILSDLQTQKGPSSSKQIKGLNHITFAVKDIEKSFAFYRDVLGFTPLCKWEGSAYFLVGDPEEPGCLWFCLDRDINRHTTTCNTHYAFSVSPEDFMAISERIMTSGVILFKENTSPGESLYFLDSDGHKLEIHVGDWKTRIAAKKAHPGKWTKVEWFV